MKTNTKQIALDKTKLFGFNQTASGKTGIQSGKQIISSKTVGGKPVINSKTVGSKPPAEHA